MNVVISLPIGILGITLWSKTQPRLSPSREARIALLLHIAGVVSSVVALFLYK
jgi:hypothetical protein